MGEFRLSKGWVVTLVGCGLAIYVVVGNKSPVSGVKVGPTELTFGPLGAPNAAELQSVAKDVRNGAPPPKVNLPPAAGENEQKELDKLAGERPAVPTKAQLNDILGMWHDTAGAQVLISTLGGNLLTYNETSNLYGVPIPSAAGQGMWTDGHFEFTFNTLAGLSGVAVLQPTNQNTLVGNAQYAATGARAPLLLSR